MSNNSENDVVHLKAVDQLPAIPSSSPTTEILKQLLEQMLENERRRLRNEYVRISMFFLVLLAAAIGGSLWFTHSLLDQLRAERQTRDQMSEVRSQKSAIRNQQPEISNTSELDLPAPSADTNTVRAQADIQRILADLEAKKRVLGDMLKSQNAQTKALLQSRDNELQVLHERMKEVQRKIMNAAPPEAQPAKKAKAPPVIEEAAVDSLTVKTPNSVTLRLPIPAP